MPTVKSQPLIDFATALLESGGLSSDEAALVAGSLVAANLRGHDSHGVMRIPFYLDRLSKGDVVAGAEFTITSESASLLVADGNWGFGQTQARRLTERLIQMARQSGVAIGTLMRSSHIGRLGEYCEQAAAVGLVSMMMANTHGSARRVAPPGGKEPRLGTNPIAIAVPNGDAPLVLDFGTSATAEGKVRVKRIAGQACPEGWLLDNQGRPTTDSNSLYAEPPGTILPMGGDQAYKGFALGLMVEILSGALSGGACNRQLPTRPLGNCVFMMVIDPAQLGGSEHFARETSDMVDFVRGCPRIEGVEEILLPGDPERRVLAKRTAEGVPLDEGNWSELVRLAERLAVPVPE